jgi:hypothetical protein
MASSKPAKTAAPLTYLSQRGVPSGQLVSFGDWQSALGYGNAL